MDKKMYRYIVLLLIVVLILIFSFWFINILTGGTKLSYVSLEEKLVVAAKKYVEDNKSVLPSEVGTSSTISSTVLINNNYIDDLSSYISDSSVNCNGKVEIYKVEDGYYNYTPVLSCGNKYNSIKLSDKVLLDNNYGVVSEDGLYERVDGEFVTDYSDLGNSSESVEYVFRGDNVNNFVKIDENVWRIVSINDVGDMLLIFSGSLQKPIAWDDRYNEDVNKNHGINNYEYNGLKSRAMESVINFYEGNTTLVDSNDYKVEYSEKTRYLTVPMNLCIGKRSLTDADDSGSIECKKILENQYVGLLPAYYYMSASLDSNCDSIVSKNCGNYNYLSYFNDDWWLLTANSDNTNEAYFVSKKVAESDLCRIKKSIRPIIMLGSRVIYDSGSGTENDPYIVKFY